VLSAVRRETLLSAVHLLHWRITRQKRTSHSLEKYIIKIYLTYIFQRVGIFPSPSMNTAWVDTCWEERPCWHDQCPHRLQCDVDIAWVDMLEKSDLLDTIRIPLTTVWCHLRISYSAHQRICSFGLGLREPTPIRPRPISASRRRATRHTRAELCENTLIQCWSLMVTYHAPYSIWKERHLTLYSSVNILSTHLFSSKEYTSLLI